MQYGLDFLDIIQDAFEPSGNLKILKASCLVFKLNLGFSFATVAILDLKAFGMSIENLHFLDVHEAEHKYPKETQTSDTFLKYKCGVFLSILR